MYREEFPVAEKLIYLNHAAVAPLSRRAAAAMQHLAQDALEFGSLHYGDWLEAYEGVRTGAARLMNASRDEIAIVKNTSEGVATVATGIAWRRGDAIVAFKEEFPANYLPWKHLESAGVEVRWLSIFDPLERVDEAAKGARLLAVSFVQYLSGYRVDLVKLGEICARRRCLFFVDAIQGMGAFPIDAEAARVSALTADGHKWLLGPEGCGVLYVRKDVQDEIRPSMLGWTNFASFADYAARDLTLRSDAARYEPGTLNTIGCFGLRAAFDLLLEIGVEKITPAVQGLADRLWNGARELGFETLGVRDAATGAGIVSIRKPGIESQYLVRKLRDANVIAAPRQGWVRLSPHFYISPEEIERVLDVIRAG